MEQAWMQILWKKTLKPKKQGKKGYVFSGLGVSNVQERIQLAYGPDYGLQYDSDGNSFYNRDDPLPTT